MPPGSPDHWVRIGSLLVPLAGAQPTEDHADAHLIVTGGDTFGSSGSPVINLRVNVRGPSANPITLEITNTSSLPSNLQFGYTHDAGTDDGDIWVRATSARNSFSITELNPTRAFRPGIGETVTVQPVGITYPSMGGGAFATKAEVEGVLDAMTVAFTKLTQDLA